MDIPVISLVTRAGWVGRTIFILLFVFSIICWAIVINRFIYLRWVGSMHKAFREKFPGFVRIADFDSLGKDILRSPLGMVSRAAVNEFHRIIDDAKSHKSVTDWSFFIQNQFAMVAERLEAETTNVSHALDRSVFFLAIISSTAPFIGLLGTIWGIMDSFFQIGLQGSASLPVVAPGIAEALVATAIALAVAIPAVFFYNFFNHRIERIEDEIDHFKDLIGLRLKREILALLYQGKSAATPQGTAKS